MLRSRVLVPLATMPLLALAALLAMRLRVVAYTLGGVALLPPLWPHAPPIVRFVLAIFACGGLARLVELHERESAMRRVLRVLTIVEWRSARRAPRRAEWRKALLAIAYAAVVALSLLAIARTRPGPLWPAWIFGAIAVWAFAEATNAALGFSLGVAGVRLAPLHDLPVLSRSLSELWGRRWNLTVSRWLRGVAFAPFAHRGNAALGVLATFVASALFHAYVAGAAGGLVVGALMGAYFVIEGCLMLAERALGLRGSRAWLLVAALLPSPLFVEPMIAIVYPRDSPLGRPACSTEIRKEPQRTDAPFTGRRQASSCP